MEDAEPNGAATIPSDGGAERPVLGNGDGAGAAAYVNDFQPRDDLPDFERYPLMHTLEGHTGAVTAARFRLDGARLASASADGTAKVWDVQAGRALHTLQGHGQGCSDVAWSFDGRLIATACDDHIIRLFDQSTGRCVRRLKGHTHHVTSVCFSSSGSLLASASFDETVRVWDVQSGDQLRAIPAHSDPILSVDFAADALKPLLLSSSTDGICRVWSSHTGEAGRTLVPEPRENPCPPVTFAKFTPNNRFVLLGTLSSKLQLWDVEGGRASGIKKTYTGHLNRRHPIQAAFLVTEPTGCKYVVMGSEDHHVFVYDLNKRSIAGILRGRATPDSPGNGHCDVVYCVDSNPATPMLATAGGARDRTIKLWKYKPPAAAGTGSAAHPRSGAPTHVPAETAPVANIGTGST